MEPVGRGVRLTEQGRVLVEHAVELLQSVERAEAAVAAAAVRPGGDTVPLTGLVRMACFQTAAHALVPGALAALASLHPRLRLMVLQAEPEEALPALRAGDVDLVVAEEYPSHPLGRSADLVHLELGRDELRLALPAAAIPSQRHGSGPIDLAGCAELAWVMEPDGTASRAWGTALCREAGFEPAVAFTSEDLLLHARLVSTGHAAALLPDLVWACAGDQGADGLTAVSLPGAPQRHLFAAVRGGSSRHPAIQAVHQVLRDQLPEGMRPSSTPVTDEGPGSPGAA